MPLRENHGYLHTLDHILRTNQGSQEFLIGEAIVHGSERLRRRLFSSIGRKLASKARRYGNGHRQAEYNTR